MAQATHILDTNQYRNNHISITFENLFA